MSDAVVKIGAIVSTDQLQEGMAANAGAVQAATQKMSVSFQEVSSKAQATAAAANRAFTSISADTKAAAAGLSDQALKEATLAKARIAANTEVRTSIKLMTNEQFDQAKATALYAAATEKVVSIDAEIAAAHKAAARAAAEAAEEAKLSSNVWIASMQRIALGAKESFGEVQKVMGETAERAGVTAQGIRLGFSGLSGLLGEALVVGFAAEFLDELAKVNNELDHLSVKTGIDITSLAGLEQIVKGMGAEFEPIANGLVRLSRAQVQAAQGSKTAQQGFSDLGISMDEVKRLSPEEMLYRVSRAIAGTGNTAVVANSAITLFGRGGAALIPVLKEQGDNLEKNMKLQGEATGITEKSAEASRRWTQGLAALTAELRRGLIPVLEVMPDILRGIEGDFLLAKAIGQTAFEGIATAVIAAGFGLAGFAKVISDVTTGNFGAVANDALAAKNRVVDIWTAGAKDITQSWKSVHETFFGAAPVIPKPIAGDDGGIPDKLPGGGKKDHAAQKLLQGMETEFAELKGMHTVTLKEESEFWAARISQFQRDTEQYKTIAEKLGTITQDVLKRDHAAIEQFKSGDTIGAVDSLTGAKKAKPQDDGSKEIAEGLKAMAAWKLQMAEDLLQTGDRWREYHAEVARGASIEATNAANMQLARISAAEAEGTITGLAAAHRIAAIHAAEEAAKLKELDAELKRIAADQNLTPVQRATQTQGVLNQKAQVAGQGQLQGQHDQAAINAAVAKPYLTAFNAIDQGWKKVQNDLIAGNKNIGRDFAQMGVSLVQKLAGNFEEVIANHVRMWIKMQATHLAATQAGVAIDAQGAAQSDSIGLLSALKQINHAAAVAAGKAWSAMADIPVVGPELGAIAAAATYAGVMALAAFDKGGVVGGVGSMEVPILAKPGERVLTPSQTNNFETMVNGGGAPRGGNTNSIRANVTQNFHGGKASSAQETRKTIQQLARRGKLSLA